MRPPPFLPMPPPPLLDGRPLPPNFPDIRFTPPRLPPPTIDRRYSDERSPPPPLPFDPAWLPPPMPAGRSPPYVDRYSPRDDDRSPSSFHSSVAASGSSTSLNKSTSGSRSRVKSPPRLVDRGPPHVARPRPEFGVPSAANIRGVYQQNFRCCFMLIRAISHEECVELDFGLVGMGTLFICRSSPGSTLVMCMCISYRHFVLFLKFNFGR